MRADVVKQRSSRALWVVRGLLLILACGCTSCVRGVKMPTFPNGVTLAPQPGAKAGARVIFYGRDHKIVPYVINALQKALRKTKLWGGLDSPMTVRIFPTHRSLEEAVLRRYAWLRAWALFHEVYLQSPRTWRMKYFHRALTELLVHELTHVVMYQQCCSRANWRHKTIPFWFREGMASYTAKQARRRWSMERLALFTRSPKGQQVLRRPEHHLTRHQPVAYSLAHWKFVHLVKGWKVGGVKRLLSQMRRGKSFAEAFANVCQISMRDFDRRFEKRLREASMLSQGRSAQRSPAIAARSLRRR